VKIFFKFLGVGWDCIHLVHRQIIGLLYQPRMIDDDECGAVGGMRIGRGNRSTRRKTGPVPFCPPQIPHDLNWARIRAATVESRWLSAWAMCLSFQIEIDRSYSPHCLRRVLSSNAQKLGSSIRIYPGHGCVPLLFLCLWCAVCVEEDFW
jgi:hypothetical protein